MVAGNIADAAYSLQSAQGSAAAAPTNRILLAGGAVAPARTIIDIEETTAARLRQRSVVSKVEVQGVPEIAARADDLGLLLLGALGSESVAGAGDPYTHTIVNAGSLPYMTWWRMLGALIFEEFVDCKIAQLVLTSESGQPLKAAATIVGLTPKARTSAQYAAIVTAVALTDEAPFMHYDGAGLFVVDGDPVSCIERIVLTINNNAVNQPGDDLTGCSVTEGMLDITAEITHTITDPDLYNLFHYADATPADLADASPDVYEPAAGLDMKWLRPGSPERSAQIVVPRVQLQTLGGYEPNTNGDPLKDTQTYKVYQPTVGNGITATVKNGRAAYAPGS
jgi:hypothetical protein